jgi:hypothetical protein
MVLRLPANTCTTEKHQQVSRQVGTLVPRPSTELLARKKSLIREITVVGLCSFRALDRLDDSPSDGPAICTACCVDCLLDLQHKYDHRSVCIRGALSHYLLILHEGIASSHDYFPSQHQCTTKPFSEDNAEQVRECSQSSYFITPN